MKSTCSTSWTVQEVAAWYVDLGYLAGLALRWSLADEAHEKRPRAVDLGKADRQDLALLGLLLGDAPAQIHIHQLHLTLAALAAQLRENLPHE